MPSPVLGVTPGDPAGIGPEIVAAAWRQRTALNLSPFAVIGGLPDWAAEDVPCQPIDDPLDAEQVFATALPVLIAHAVEAIPGRPDLAGARFAFAALEAGAALALSRGIAGLVTAPVAKAQLQQAGFRWPGQTEFLAERCGIAETDTVMMLATGTLRTVPLTIHIPLAQAPVQLTHDLIVHRALVVADALRKDFGIARPRLVLAGLNPHAGEQGAIGREEIDVMAPAVAALRSQGVDIRGPVSADSLFHAAARATYDAALCPTHDQALIPVKALGFDEGVNVTLGLPIIRTSPDHGTAFDLAGKGLASPDSFIAALRLAAQIVQARSHV